MTSDFDNDEIQDSAFPVEFNDDTSSLDLYGVWVKSGPRDAGTLSDKTPSLSAMPELSMEMPDYSDISLLPDLPDFTDLAETEADTTEFLPEEPLAPIEEDVVPAAVETVVDASWDDASITFEDIVPDYSTVEEAEPVHFAERAASETVSVSEFDAIDTSDFFETAESPESMTDDAFGSAYDNTGIVFEDILSEELESSSAVTPKDAPPASTNFKKPVESRVFETVDIFEMEEPLSSIQEISEPPADIATESPPAEEEAPQFSDSPEFDLDDSFGTENLSAESESFELEEPGSFSTDSTDLDSFINDFNESGGTAEEEKNKLMGELDPVEIDLDFDESFIADAEKIKATGSAVTESEFLQSEFGVEMVEESASLADADFGTVFDLPSDSARESAVSASVPGFSTDLQETDEFDELLVSLDRAPSPVQQVRAEDTSRKNLYDLSVTEEDGEEILDIPVIKDYNRSESGHLGENSVTSSVEKSVSLDFDDISAVEQDLNDMTPETGDETVVNNDKSTQLLMQIADELSSIKKELSTLKTEIAGFKSSGQNPDLITPGAEIDDTDNSGFFNDDDTDETIALTGDELNNILITADFTEEKNEETAGMPDLSMQFDSSEETAEINFEESPGAAGFSGFSAEMEEHDIPDTLPDSIFEIPDLEVSIPVEASYVNKLEEDTSYLEGSDLSDTILDDLAIDEPELETIDFDDEKLEEPELTEFNIDLSNIDSTFPPEQEVSIPRDMPVEEESAAFDVPVVVEEPFAEPAPEPAAAPKEAAPASGMAALPVDLKDEIKSVLAYMDQLLESLPEEKIEEFARSEHFEVYRKLFEELGIS